MEGTVVFDTFELDGCVLERHGYGEYGVGSELDIVPRLLKKYDNGEGHIPSEAELLTLLLENYEAVKELDEMSFVTATLLAINGHKAKVILPYENGSPALTEAARFGLELMHPNADLTDFPRGDGSGIDLGIEDRWEKLNGLGVYSLDIDSLILNRDLTWDEAKNHKLILTKLGHPDYVDSAFAQPKEKVAETIDKIFDYGWGNGRKATAMYQSMYPARYGEKVLSPLYFTSLFDEASSNGKSCVAREGAAFAFVRPSSSSSSSSGASDKSTSSLEASLKENIVPAIKSGKSFEYNGLLYTPTDVSTGAGTSSKGD